MKEDIKRHKMMLPNTYMETAIAADDYSMPFVEIRFFIVKSDGSEINDTGRYKWLNREQVEELIIDLQKKVANL